MQHKRAGHQGIAIRTLLLRYFLPAIAIIAIALAIFVYNRIYDTILEGFDNKLETTSALTGALIDPRDHDWLIEQARKGQASGGLTEDEVADTEQSAEYLRNVIPMRHVREKLGLTYLYTQLIVDDGDILYILDATQGDEHSPLGSADQLPAETMDGLRKIAEDGSVYISPIEYQEQWGLLKTAAAPVGSMDANIAASAGADVNISVIQIATQNILFASALIGLGSLLACGLVTLILVRRIAVPIAQIKSDALKIAVGNLTPPEQITSPREAANLGKSLANITRKISGKRDEIVAKVQSSELEQNAKFIDAILSSDNQSRIVRLVDNDAILAIWIARTLPPPEMSLKIQAMTMLAGRIAEDGDLASNWRSLVDIDNESVLILDRATGMATLTGGTAFNLQKGEEKARTTLLSPGESIALGEAEQITLFQGEAGFTINQLKGTAS